MPETGSSKRTRPLKSLPTRAFFVVLTLTLVTALGVAGVSLLTVLDLLRADLDERQPQRLEATGVAVTAWLEDGRIALERLAENLPPDGGLGAATLDWALQDSAFFEGLTLTAGEGEVLQRAGHPGAPPGGFRTPRPTAGSAQLWAVEAIFDGSPLLASISLPGGPHQGGSTLHASFRRDRVVELLASESHVTAGRLCLVDAEGRVRSALCSEAEPRPGADAATRPFGSLSSAGSHLVRRADGQRAMAAARALPELEWWLLIEQPLEQAAAPLVGIALRAGLVSLGLVLCFAWMGRRSAKRALAPLHALRDAVERVGEGEFDFELPAVAGRGEFADLAESLEAMTRSLQQRKKALETGTRSLRAQNDELQRANEVLEQLSITDGLTRLHNHRFFQDHLTREIKRVSRTREPLSMLVCDIDNFKRLNDRQGHKAGDELLVGLARIMNESIRENDFLARYGGEEFVVLAPVTDLEGAVALAEKVRRAVEDSPFILGDSKQLTRATLSIGVAQYKGNRRSFFQAADQALYRAKAAGKNCVIAAEE